MLSGALQRSHGQDQLDHISEEYVNPNIGLQWWRSHKLERCLFSVLGKVFWIQQGERCHNCRVQWKTSWIRTQEIESKEIDTGHSCCIFFCHCFNWPSKVIVTAWQDSSSSRLVWIIPLLLFVMTMEAVFRLQYRICRLPGCKETRHWVIVWWFGKAGKEDKYPGEGRRSSLALN